MSRDWPSLVLLVAAGLLVVLVAFFLFYPSPPETKEELFPKSLKSLGKLDPDWVVTGLDGKEIRMGDLAGKVLFINHWEYFCPPCIEEMPSIQRLYESFKDTEVVFLIVASESPESVKKLVKEKGWSLPIYLASERFPPVLRTKYIPATFVVDRRGNLVHRQVGPLEWDSREVKDFLKNIP